MKDYVISLDDKKTKSNFINTLDFFNNITKNIYNTFYIDSKGIIYSSNILFEQTKCVCETKGFIDLFELDSKDIIELFPMKIYECIKGGKTKIIDLYVKDNEIFMNTENISYNIGKYISDVNLDIDKLKYIENKSIINEEYNELKEILNKKRFIDINIEGYRMFITHKLFSNITKIENINISIMPEENTFYSIFELSYTYKKCSIKVKYYYHFVKI